METCSSACAVPLPAGANAKHPAAPACRPDAGMCRAWRACRGLHLRGEGGRQPWNITSRYLKGIGYRSRLQDYNRILAPRTIRPGTTLRIPLAWMRGEAVAAQVVELRGRADLRQGGAVVALKVGMSVGNGAILRTFEQASLVLAFPDGSRSAVGGDSEVRLPSCGGCALRMPKRSGLNSGAAISRTWWRACAAVGAIPSRRQPASPRCAARCSGCRPKQGRCGPKPWAARWRLATAPAPPPGGRHGFAGRSRQRALAGTCAVAAARPFGAAGANRAPALQSGLCAGGRRRRLSQPRPVAAGHGGERFRTDGWRSASRGAAELPDGRYRLLVRAVTGTAWKASMPSARSSSMRAGTTVRADAGAGRLRDRSAAGVSGPAAASR